MSKMLYMEEFVFHYDNTYEATEAFVTLSKVFCKHGYTCGFGRGEKDGEYIFYVKECI